MTERTEKRYLTRFSYYRIIEHWSHALIFIVLLVTGLSQKFYEYDISQWIIMSVGGIDVVRIVHRYAGIFYTVLFVGHIIIASFGILFLKWKPSIVITKKDFLDLIENLKYYLGMSERPAMCDRYNYKQKFEYWGVFVSGVIMMTTGFMLWFPVFVIGLLPGEFIPAAKILHTNQALLIFIIIAIWHIYNSVFSPDVFPVDRAMFSGKITEERMIKEHPLEYQRIYGVSIEGQGEQPPADNSLRA